MKSDIYLITGELLLWPIQVLINCGIYVGMWVLSSKHITGLATQVLVPVQVLLMIAQVVAITLYGRDKFLSEELGIRLLEEAALWHIRMSFAVRPMLAALSVLLDLESLKRELNRDGISREVQHACDEVKARAILDWKGRLGAVGYVTRWRNSKPNAVHAAKCALKGELSYEIGLLNVVFVRRDEAGRSAGKELFEADEQATNDVV